jgi:MFS family permease
MTTLFKDRKLLRIVLANLISSVGMGITMIAIPWMLVTGENGDQIYGYAAFAVTLGLFFVTPYIGMIVDRLSRKRLLLVVNGAGVVLIGGFSAYGWMGLEYTTALYVTIYALGALYYAIFFPTMFAFGQEIFPKSQYQALNGVLEVQSQVATMISGAVSSMLIAKVEIYTILLLNTLSYLGAFLVLLTIPYVRKQRPVQTESFWYQLTDGYRYMKQDPMLFLFFTASFLPFIGVMVTNYLFPVYIANVLLADASVYGFNSMSYAIGAALAGFTLPFLIGKIGSNRAVISTFILYTLGLLVIVLVPVVSLFLLMSVLLGFGNAGTRVTRNTLLMELVPNDKIGRASSLFQFIGIGFRITLIGIFAQTIPLTGATFSLGVLVALMIIALLCVLYSMRHLSQVRDASVSNGSSWSRSAFSK